MDASQISMRMRRRATNQHCGNTVVRNADHLFMRGMTGQTSAVGMKLSYLGVSAAEIATMQNMRASAPTLEDKTGAATGHKTTTAVTARQVASAMTSRIMQQSMTGTERIALATVCKVRTFPSTHVQAASRTQSSPGLRLTSVHSSAHKRR